MSGSGSTLEVVAYWLERAQSALDSARAEHAAGRHEFATNRAYYAAFYAASAALLSRGRRFVKHSGLRAAVHRDLVKTGLVDASAGKTFDRLFEARQRADYFELVRTEADEAAALIDAAEAFVRQIERLLAD